MTASPGLVRETTPLPALTASPTLADIQRYVQALEVRRGFADDNLLQKCVLLSEEVGELLKTLRKSRLDICVDCSVTYESDPAGELADLITVLAAIANRLDIDLEAAFRAKEQVNATRQWL